jgi:hypothetical protein
MIRRTVVSFALLSAAGLLTAPSAVSDPIGVYAVLDSVIVRNEGTASATIQLWGSFAYQSRVGSYTLGRGYFHYKAAENARATQVEWADLKSLMATPIKRVVAYGAPGVMGRIRDAKETPSDPDTYPVGCCGIVSGRVRFHVEDLSSPSIVRPLPDALVAAGPVTLVVGSTIPAPVRFEIWPADSARRWSIPVSCAGWCELSDHLTPTANEVKWTPGMKLKPGVKYAWRAYYGNVGAFSSHATLIVSR